MEAFYWLQDPRKLVEWVVPYWFVDAAWAEHWQWTQNGLPMLTYAEIWQNCSPSRPVRLQVLGYPVRLAPVTQIYLIMSDGVDLMWDQRR